MAQYQGNDLEYRIDWRAYFIQLTIWIASTALNRTALWYIHLQFEGYLTEYVASALSMISSARVQLLLVMVVVPFIYSVL
mmetsp:Transcript_12117/g.26423  ORF Transcript_12117/g.26423 Transcript_12117/m.26423 type:complete len:80 (+) Transcript_12117:382-621(+)